MEQVALLELGLGNKMLNADNQINNLENKGNLLIQELNIRSFNQILNSLTNEDQSIQTDENKDGLLSKLSDILQKSDEVSIDLMNWFNELSDKEQIMVYNMANNLLYLTNVFQSENQEILKFNTQEDNQLNLQKNSTVINNYLLDNNKELQKLFAAMDEKSSEIRLLLSNTMEISKENLISNGDKNNKDFNYLNDIKTNNLQNNLLFSSLPNFNRTSFSNYIDQNSEAKIIDLNQLQMNFNGILNDAEVDNKLLNNKEELQNLFVNKDFTSELGKVIIKNLKLPNGASETKIQLQPKELGQINVKLSAHNGQISAQIIAETLMGKEMLESQIHQLKNSLTILGFQVERIDVQLVTSTTANQNSSSSNQYNGSFEFSEQKPSQQQNYEQDNRAYLNNNFVSEEELTNDIYFVSGIDYTV